MNSSKRSRVWLYVALGLVAIAIAIIITQVNLTPLTQPLDNFAFQWGDRYQQWMNNRGSQNPLILMLLAFAGGLVASISPCILSLLPVNLTYIGTRQIASRRDAFFKAAAFVLGVVTVLSLFGLFSSLAGAVLVKFTGYFHLAVGILIFLMALSLWGIIHLPLPQNQFKFPLAGPYGIGLTFALVSSPCSSPVIVAAIAAAGATGSHFYGTLIMVSYSLGYTAVIFLASLFTGFAKQTRTLLQHSETIIHLSGMALMLVGLYYLVNGIRWFAAIAAVS